MRVANCVKCGSEFTMRTCPTDHCPNCRVRKPWTRRDGERSRRRRAVHPRPRTTLSARDVENAPKSFVPEPDPRPTELVAERPVTRADCAGGERPCPWVSCRHHLYLDADPRTGAIKLNFPDLEPWELERSCALDVADEKAITLEEVGDITNLTRERVRQVELRAMFMVRGPMRSVR